MKNSHTTSVPGRPKLVILTGSGISAESGIDTYRDKQGLWARHDHHEVASPEGWKADRAKVLTFWNQCRQQVMKAQPNAAHYGLRDLETHFDVCLITQNTDDLHERAGAVNVLHLHGEIMKSRSSQNRHRIYETQGRDIVIGDRAEDGSQLRPHVVWFGEYVPLYEQALAQVRAADWLLVVGTSLTVYPAAHLVSKRRPECRLVVVDPNGEAGDYRLFKENATTGVPSAVAYLNRQIQSSHHEMS